MSKHAAVTLVLGQLASALLLVGCDGSTGGGGGAKPEGVSGLGTEQLAESGHLLRRLGFGPTPAELVRVAGIGADAYIGEQLDPASIDESGLEPLTTWKSLLPLPASEQDQPTLASLVERQYARAIWSPRQLSESMTLFWEGHFNTNYWTVFNHVGGDESRAAWIETRENERFRGLALGRFEDLLRVSATSPAMLITLDNVHNVSGNPNENFARELVELFTMGVDNGYTQHDVEELARCFTGWGLCEVAPGDEDDPLAPCASGTPGATLAFHFDAALHDTGPKTIFAGTAWELALPARPGTAGLQDGFDVLHHVAALPQTAWFVSKKLAQKFVADDPSDALVGAARDAWIASGGEIAEVLRALFASSDFRSPTARWSKVETPFESLCSSVRALDGFASRRIELTNFRAVLEMRLNQSLFRWLTPDGFPEEGDEQLGTGRVLGRIAFHEWIYLGQGDDIHFDVERLLAENGARRGDAASLVDVLGRLVHQENFSAADRALALSFATTDEQGAPRPLSASAPDYDLRLKELAAFVASLPQGMLQ